MIELKFHRSGDELAPATFVGIVLPFVVFRAITFEVKLVAKTETTTNRHTALIAKTFNSIFISTRHVKNFIQRKTRTTSELIRVLSALYLP
jgi:hypothetical protein